MLPTMRQAARRMAQAGVALAALASLGTSAAQAAQTTTMQYRCKFPLIGTQPLTLTATTELPESVRVNQVIPPTPVSVRAEIGGTFAQGVELIEGLHSIRSMGPGETSPVPSSLTWRVNRPEGVGTAIKIPLAIAPWVPERPIPNPVVWQGTGQTPQLVFEQPGRATIEQTALLFNLKAVDAEGNAIEGMRTPPEDIDRPGVVYPDVDIYLETFNVPCKEGSMTGLPRIGNGIEVTPSMELDQTPPSIPVEPELGAYQPSDFTSTETNLHWVGTRDEAGGSGLKQYVISWDGGPEGGVIAPAGATSAWVPVPIGRCGTGKEFEIRAVDFAGNVSEPLVHFVTPALIVDQSPPQTGTVVGMSTDTSVSLTWPVVPPARCGPLTVAYNVYRDGTKIATVTGTSHVATGLAPDTTYTFAIEPVDANGGTGARSSVTVKTKPVVGPVKYAYALAGSTTLNTLTKGTLALKGAIAAELTLATGAFTADLTLNDTSGRLVAAGFLPVTAKIGFAPSGKTTGTLMDGVLKTNSKVRIKVKEVKLFGAIPLAGGNSCQTRSLSDINLQSTQDEFSPLVGGPIAGTYKISDLNGCGALNGLVSPLTAGDGNTIALNLTPAP